MGISMIGINSVGFTDVLQELYLDLMSFVELGASLEAYLEKNQTRLIGPRRVFGFIIKDYSGGKLNLRDSAPRRETLGRGVRYSRVEEASACITAALRAVYGDVHKLPGEELSLKSEFKHVLLIREIGIELKELESQLFALVGDEKKFPLTHYYGSIPDKGSDCLVDNIVDRVRRAFPDKTKIERAEKFLRALYREVQKAMEEKKK